MTHPTEAGERERPFQIVKRVVRNEAFRLQRLHAAGDTENVRTAIPRIAGRIVEALRAADLLRTEPSTLVCEYETCDFPLTECNLGKHDASECRHTRRAETPRGFDSPDEADRKALAREIAKKTNVGLYSVELVLAAATAPREEGEPVAWRWRKRDSRYRDEVRWTDWRYVEQPIAESDRIQCEALYTKES